MTQLVPPDGSKAGASVDLRRLVKRYQQVVAVNDVSFQIQPGEFVALLGPSGSGKTTILMMVAGFENPTAGEILIEGQPMSAVPPHKRGIGMVFQRYALFPHMTVADNVAFPLRMRHVEARKRKEMVADALDLVRLPGYGLRRPNELSGGQQQRIAMARAIVYRPRVLLMDEPLGALDKKLREELQIEIKHIQRQLGTTVLYVTHDQTEALTMADRVAVLDVGLLQQLGPPRTVYDEPANPFVAAFMGETNLLEGIVSRRTGNSAIALVDGAEVPLAIRADDEPHCIIGAGVRISIRPESVQLRAAQAASGLSGVVAEIIDRGDTASVVTRLASGKHVTSRTIRTSAAWQSWKPGDNVELSWERGDERLFWRRE